MTTAAYFKARMVALGVIGVIALSPITDRFVGRYMENRDRLAEIAWEREKLRDEDYRNMTHYEKQLDQIKNSKLLK